MNLDATGSLQWQIPYTLENYTFGATVAEIPRAGFVIVATTRLSDNAGWNDDSSILVIRTGSSGNTECSHTFGGDGDE
jgi:hypothetical protein